MSIHKLNQAEGLTEQTAQLVRERIQVGYWSRGDKLPTEAALVQALGVSRTVVREAVSRLKSEGLLVSRQGAGVFVATDEVIRSLKFNSVLKKPGESVLHIVQLRRALESEAAALAAQSADSKQRKTIAKAFEAIELAVSKGEDGVAEDLYFHRSIAAATGNPYLAELFDFIAQYMQQAMRVTRANEARRAEFAAQVVSEHQAIVDAIEARDADRARHSAALHMDNAAGRLAAPTKTKPL